MHCIDYRWLLHAHLRAIIEFAYSPSGRKSYTRPITRYYNLLGFPIQNNVW